MKNLLRVLGSLAVLIFVGVLLGLFPEASFANQPGGGNHKPPSADNSTQLKTIAITVVLAVAMLYKKHKKKAANKEAYKKNRTHDEQVETLARLKKAYKSAYSRIYPHGHADDQLTIECQSCQKTNLLYAERCKFCGEYISLDATIALYQAKIKALEIETAEGVPTGN